MRRQAAVNRFVRYRLANEDLDLAIGRENVGSTTADDGRFFYLRTAGGYENRCRPVDGPNSPCLLRTTGPIDFE